MPKASCSERKKWQVPLHLPVLPQGPKRNPKKSLALDRVTVQQVLGAKSSKIVTPAVHSNYDVNPQRIQFEVSEGRN